MKIDILREPVPDIYRNRDKYLWGCVATLALVLGGALLMGYGFFADISRTETLETAGLTLFTCAALVFAYFSEKLRAYKKLGPHQKQELIELASKHPEISAYCSQVAKAGRAPIFAEYEACREWVEDLGYQA